MDTVSSFFKRRTQEQLSITGDWVLANFGELKKINHQLNQELSSSKIIDFSELNQLDTNGAHLLIKMLGAERIQVILQQDDTLPPAFHSRPHAAQWPAPAISVPRRRNRELQPPRQCPGYPGSRAGCRSRTNRRPSHRSR